MKVSIEMLIPDCSTHHIIITAESKKRLATFTPRDMPDPKHLKGKGIHRCM